MGRFSWLVVDWRSDIGPAYGSEALNWHNIKRCNCVTDAMREEQLAQLDNLISAWADTSGFGTLQQRAAANGYTYTTGLSADWQKKLTALEAFNGQGYFRMPWEGASFGGSALQGLTIGWQGNPKALHCRNTSNERANYQ